MIRRLPYRFKQGLRRSFRVLFGIDLRFANNYNRDEMTYEGDSWYTRRLLHFEQLLRQVENVEGRIVECGVGPGRSIFAFSVLTQTVTRPREIWGYDTFEGMPPPTVEDGEANAGFAGIWSYSQSNVRKLLEFNGVDRCFIQSQIQFKPGHLEDTLPDYDGEPIALLHLDVDFYSSYKVALECLWPHVAIGGIVAFDEYQMSMWPGATQAIDEFFSSREESLSKSPLVDLYYVVKQRLDKQSAPLQG